MDRISPPGAAPDRVDGGGAGVVAVVQLIAGRRPDKQDNSPGKAKGRDKAKAKVSGRIAASGGGAAAAVAVDGRRSRVRWITAIARVVALVKATTIVRALAGDAYSLSPSSTSTPTSNRCRRTATRIP